jgi:dolichol kinase
MYGIVLIALVVVLQLYTAKHKYTPSMSSEGKRRIQHGITGCILVLISYCIPIYMCILLLIMATYIIYYLKTYYFHTLYLSNFGPLLRDNEKQPQSSPDNPSDTSSSSSQIPLPGAYYFLFGTTITTIVFPIRIARYSVLCLSLADPMAAYIGQSIPSYRLDQMQQYLHHRLRIVTNATLSGCIACFITAWMIGYVLLVVPNETATATKYENPIITITAGALACCIAEAIPFIRGGNDNLQIPIFTALIVTMVS